MFYLMLYSEENCSTYLYLKPTTNYWNNGSCFALNDDNLNREQSFYLFTFAKIFLLGKKYFLGYLKAYLIIITLKYCKKYSFEDHYCKFF